MKGSTKEIEVKLPFESASVARRELERLGAKLAEPRTFEDNTLFDREHDPLHTTDRMLRVRRFGNDTVLTYKAKVTGTHRHKVHTEYETRVADRDGLVRILEALGFRSAYRYQKYRTTLRLEGLSVCLDETPLGCFVELEGPPSTIDDVARRLGFGPDRYVCLTYRELHEEEAARRGQPVGDLLIESEPVP